MKKQRKVLTTLMKHSLLLFLVGYTLQLKAQFLEGSSLKLDGNVYQQNYAGNYSGGNRYIDATIPSGYEGNIIYFKLTGADGGDVTMEGDDGVNIERHGGKGALAFAGFKIGSGDNDLHPGSTLRFILGEKGGSSFLVGAGGGGSAVCYLPTGKTDWEILMVAGAGGGGAGWRETGLSDGILHMTKPGQAGGTTTEGSGGGYTADYQNDMGKYGGEQGENGQDGGGGIRINPKYPPNIYTGGAGISPQGPTGANGAIGDEPDKNYRGGFGFGGGGAGRVTIHNSDHLSLGHGGGGGGYSGGGAGGEWGGGGGGGSYINPKANFSSLQSDPTDDSANGFVAYQLNTLKKIRLANNTAHCIDDSGGQLDNNTNIQLWTCQEGNPNQQWLLEDFQIKLGLSLNKCIDLDGSNQSNGRNIQLFDCNGTDAQKWIYDGISKQLRYVANPNKCLDLVNGNTANGTNIQLYDCVYTNFQVNQQWEVPLGNAIKIDNKVTDRKTGSISPIAAETKCVSLQGYSVSNNTNIQLGACNGAYGTYGDRDQAWYFDGVQIKLNKTQNDSPGKCLDLDGSNTTNGRNIQLFDCNGTKAQKWLYDGTTNQFRSSIDPNKCLDISNGVGKGFASGTNLQIWDCMSGNPNQQFIIKNI